MRVYEEEYYILKRAEFRESFLSLRATENTGERNHTYEKLDFAEGPVFFENAYKGEIPFQLADAQMDSIYPVVSCKVASVFRGYNIDGFQLFPAVIIDDDGLCNENFYFFNFYQPLDCIDFARSVVRNYNENRSNNTVIKFKLKSEVMEKIALENRLVFKASGVTGGALIFHEKLVKTLSCFDISAFKFYRLSSYRKGMEFE